MALEQLAVISDIHGNVTALEAVLADIDARGVSTILNLGDVAGKGPRGSECVRISRERCAATVQGNWDQFLPAHREQDSEGVQWWQRELTSDDQEWLSGLPFAYDLTLSGRWIRLFHASAQSVHTRVHFQHTDEQFDGMFASTEMTGDGPEPAVVGYGDIHTVYLESRNGRKLFNAGSVGNSLDEPTASYVILEGVPDGSSSDPFGLQFVRVGYDIEAEIAVAADLGMPEFDSYAVELRTAVYRGLHAKLGLTAANTRAAS